MDKNKTLELANDYIFKRVFSKKGNEDILKDMLESILEIKIGKIEVVPEAKLEKVHKEDKLSSMDLKSTVNKKITVDIEIQVKDYHNIVERSLFYISGLYHTGLKSGGSKKLRQWLDFIANKRKEEINVAVKENEKIAKAQKEYEYLTGDAEVQRLAFLRDKWESDHNSDIAWNRREAKREGKKEGKKEEKIEIAKNLLKENVPIEIIIKATGLKKEEIEKIAKQIK